MTKYLIAGLVLAAAATASAQSRTFTAPVEQRNAATQRPAPAPSQPVAVGAFPRAARGNPVQMLNPLAPARYYGPPQDTVLPAPYTYARNQHTRQEPQYAGVILFGLRW